MFERYTEKARRVIFFARYEASQYGSPSIESEHILLGLLREDYLLMRRVLGSQGNASEIRAEIERGIQRRERIATRVEVPLARECQGILRSAEDEATQLGHRRVGPEHLLLGALMATGSVAAKILTQRGVQLPALREDLKHGSGLSTAHTQMLEDATDFIRSFLAGIGWAQWEDIRTYFTTDAQFVDSSGKRWKGREEIGNQFEALMVPYAKKGVTFILESADLGAAGAVVGSVLWENVRISGGTDKLVQRMTIIVEQKGKDWEIFFLQVTPVRNL